MKTSPTKFVNRPISWHRLSRALAATVLIFLNQPGFTAETVPLYGKFEIDVTNNNRYSNPFDFTEIELQGTFTSPSGVVTSFFGFYDGDGSGGQNGNVWKIRFMPTETGTYKYRLYFSDDTEIANHSGDFQVVSSSLPGPVQLYSRDSRFLADASDTPIKWKAYSMAFAHYSSNHEPRTQYRDMSDKMTFLIDRHIVSQGYNATMIESPLQEKGAGNGLHLDNDLTRYNLATTIVLDAILNELAANKIWVINWVSFTHQKRWTALYKNHRKFIRYFVARYSPYYNYFAWSPTWETWELPDEIVRVETMAKYINKISPWPKFPTTHDRARTEWTDWQKVQLRQQQSRTIFDGNNRTADGFSDYQYVIIGAEDHWEYCSGAFGQPRNGTEVRRGIWGALLAGVYTMYSEWHHSATGNNGPCAGNANGEGDAFNRLAMRFWYDNTTWYKYEILNHLVSRADRQIASGIPDIEYVVYDEDGGSIELDLSGTNSLSSFAVLWLNPSNGKQERGPNVLGGNIRSFSSPYFGDTILLLIKTSSENCGGRTTVAGGCDAI